MKTKEELEALKQEVIRLEEKLKELSEEELKEITGGAGEIDIEVFNNWEILPTINQCNFDNNKAKSEGGALFIDDKELVK